VAIEIVSPEQSTNALAPWWVWCVDNGVDLALLVDPADRFERGMAPKGILRIDGRIEFGSVLGERAIAVAELFGSIASQHIGGAAACLCLQPPAALLGQGDMHAQLRGPRAGRS
jgi:hypothetical protein